MAVVKELMRSEANGGISFGNYKLREKGKLDDFKHNGDLYKVRTHNQVTKVDKNGRLIYESVPGTAVTNFVANANQVKFIVEGAEDAQITLELADETEYQITVNDNFVGVMKTNLSGKLNMSVELEANTESTVLVEKCNVSE